MRGILRRALEVARRSAQRTLEFVAARTRLKLPEGPVPPSWSGVVDRNVPLAARLDPAQRERLLKLTQLLLHEVPFEGCGGLEITDEIRVTIAATACILLVNLPYPRFLKLRRIMVYPDTFVPARSVSRHDTIHVEEVATLGEAWTDGIVVLSWTHVLADSSPSGDRRNVVLHEFAHVLDHEDGYSDGVPILDSEELGSEWSHVLNEEFVRQHDAVAQERDAALDPYAATHPAEFFAVATEVFFETPAYLRDRLPTLYDQLSRYYRQDPAQNPRVSERR